ncbi:MAG: polyphenol oxidase family protein, partial [Myxococcota bacterium]|nr:polyphenol oxidase family protein [Myxococcota bacterium]
WAGVLARLPVSARAPALVSQVHGTRMLEAFSPGLVGEADAVFTRVRGLPIAIRTADCVPVLLAGDAVVAAVHAGWRGAAAGIVPAVVTALRSAQLGSGLAAAVGPAISGRHYEVGPEVVAAFREAAVPDHAFLVRPPGAVKDHVDVRGAVAWQLSSLGIEAVEVLPHCTYADPGLHSWRRDGPSAGRLAAVIARC